MTRGEIKERPEASKNSVTIGRHAEGFVYLETIKQELTWSRENIGRKTHRHRARRMFRQRVPTKEMKEIINSGPVISGVRLLEGLTTT